MKRNESKLTALLLCMGVSAAAPVNIWAAGAPEVNVVQQSQKTLGKVVDANGDPIIGATIK